MILTVEADGSVEIKTGVRPPSSGHLLPFSPSGKRSPKGG